MHSFRPAKVKLARELFFFATLIEPRWIEENEVDTLLFNRPRPDVIPGQDTFLAQITFGLSTLSPVLVGRPSGLACCAFGAHCEDTGTRGWLSSRPVS